MSSALKIAIVVHGRFHAFDLGRELIAQGAEVTLLTNYPKRIAANFGIPPARVRNCIRHGIAARVVRRIGGVNAQKRFEPHLHRWFSRWAAKTVSDMHLDAIHSFSGVSEEIFRNVQPQTLLKSLVRGSAHIRAQSRLLEEEEQRCGQKLDRPSDWMIDREAREYELADIVIVLSSFAARTFLDEGFPRAKLKTLPLGSQLSKFRASNEAVERRCGYILSGRRLRVLTVGSFSFRKGASDLANIAKALSGAMEFCFVGDFPNETLALRHQLREKVQFVPRQPQFALTRWYENADLFLFPTIEDGYAVVLAQANASGLPILTTTNCAGPDLVKEGRTGWVLPIRQPEAFIQRLKWCDSHRPELAEMVQQSYLNFQPRDWSQVATDLIGIYESCIRTNKN